MEVTPEGELLNTAALKKISTSEGKVFLYYVDGSTEVHRLDGEWKKFLKKLSLENRGQGD